MHSERRYLFRSSQLGPNAYLGRKINFTVRLAADGADPATLLDGWAVYTNLFLAAVAATPGLPEGTRHRAHRVNPSRERGNLLSPRFVHVWMPALVQVVYEPFERVIGCGHVSGLSLRH